MVVGVIGVNALMAIKLGTVTVLLQQMEDYPALVQTEDCVQ